MVRWFESASVHLAWELVPIHGLSHRVVWILASTAGVLLCRRAIAQSSGTVDSRGPSWLSLRVVPNLWKAESELGWPMRRARDRAEPAGVCR